MVGQSISELYSHNEEVMHFRADVLAKESPYYGTSFPTLITSDLSEADCKTVCQMHSYLAIVMGLDPNDQCLGWFDDPQYLPTPEQIIAFEQDFLEAAGTTLMEAGRLRAFKLLEEILGSVGPKERKDMMALPFAWVREMQNSSMEDDRMLLALRLERLANKAADALDVRTELAAARELARVQGLTFRDDEKSQRDLLSLFSQPRKTQKLLEDNEP